MGFGVNLAFVFLVIPSTIILLIIAFIGKSKFYLKAVGVMWAVLLSIMVLASVIKWMTSIKQLDKSDYFGSYIVDRSYFAGKQADWQYDHFRFEIKNNDSIYFYKTDGESITKVYKGSITTVRPYGSDRLVVHMDTPIHHIMHDSYPTIYRSAWSFKVVFHSPLYNNVFFKKGEWAELSK
ncbi:hypothetical protein [uncultured Mucilaginibacter sp.]|uniref:hypothetical protein n=1 Tax=uncultured Mucilaginibacter sp. TaxID=797541 RepID=UPI0025F247BB|nr:hypothetical protein [uncultured Mucilaginibacter sp.]